ncbi:MAG: hypothetical protein RIR45_1371 [Pseudomonadota bacterium]|jgi:hypothetical protein
MAIAPLQNGSYEKYAGKGSGFALFFVTPGQTTPLDAFPEAPFFVENLTTGETCTGGESVGIWDKNLVYRTENDRVLILGSFSGSSTGWEFYDAKTSAHIAWVENSADPKSVFVRGNQIVFSKGLPASLKRFLGSAAPQSGK